MLQARGLPQVTATRRSCSAKSRCRCSRTRPCFKDLSFSGAARVTNVKSVRDDGFTDKDNGQLDLQARRQLGREQLAAVPRDLRNVVPLASTVRAVQGDETSFPARARSTRASTGDQLKPSGNISHRIAAQLRVARNPGRLWRRLDHRDGPFAGRHRRARSGNVDGADGEHHPDADASRFLPQTRLSLAVDYFDIKVKGEVSQLGAANIVFGCYNSRLLPERSAVQPVHARHRGRSVHRSRRCTTSTSTSPASRISGLDFTALIQHNLGSLGAPDAARQCDLPAQGRPGAIPKTTDCTDHQRPGRRSEVRLPTSTRPWKPATAGPSSGARRFTARHRTRRSSSDPQRLAVQCRPTSIVTHCGDYCVHVSVPTTCYHAASVTKEFGPPKKAGGDARHAEHLRHQAAEGQHDRRRRHSVAHRTGGRHLAVRLPRPAYLLRISRKKF